MERYFEIGDIEYTIDEVKTFVECIMSNNLDVEYTLKCLTAIALQAQIDEEERVESEVNEEGVEEQWKTSDFIEFIDAGLVFLLHDKDPQSWIKLYRETLLKLERYETLHTLKLEQKWNI
tara:strand:+ start:121 stop:480 length:360 start_codon:yes stop_codon:yes gene_type:complete